MFKPRKKTEEELIRDLKDSLKLLKLNIHAYSNGIKECYKVVATQLRILLCDTDGRGGDNSLLPKIFPNCKFHPLVSQPVPNEFSGPRKKLLFFIPGEFKEENGVRSFRLVFDESKNPIPIDTWLSQYMIDFSITIRELIRSVANKDGGAHVDSDINETLSKAKNLGIYEDSGDARLIVEIGRYIHNEIIELLKQYKN